MRSNSIAEPNLPRAATAAPPPAAPTRHTKFLDPKTITYQQPWSHIDPHRRQQHRREGYTHSTGKEMIARNIRRRRDPGQDAGSTARRYRMASWIVSRLQRPYIAAVATIALRRYLAISNFTTSCFVRGLPACP